MLNCIVLTANKIKVRSLAYPPLKTGQPRLHQRLPVLEAGVATFRLETTRINNNYQLLINHLLLLFYEQGQPHFDSRLPVFLKTILEQAGGANYNILFVNPISYKGWRLIRPKNTCRNRRANHFVGFSNLVKSCCPNSDIYI